MIKFFKNFIYYNKGVHKMRILTSHKKIQPVTKITKIYKLKKNLKENEKECPLCHSVFITNKNENRIICPACEFDPKN